MLVIEKRIPITKPGSAAFLLTVPSACRPISTNSYVCRSGGTMQVSRNLRFPVVLLLAFLLTCLGYCVAQMPASAPLDASSRKAVITKLADELRARYVFPEKGIEAGETIK